MVRGARAFLFAAGEKFLLFDRLAHASLYFLGLLFFRDLTMNLDKHVEIDAAIVQAAQNIKVLSRLTWPAETMEAFLHDWERGKPRLPRVEYPGSDDLNAPARALAQAAKTLESFDDPIAD
jgi:hypothetical protein